MKQYLLILIIIITIFISCKPKTDSDRKGTWSKKYWNETFKELNDYAQKNGVPNGSIFVYVSCAITDLEAKFPNENFDKHSPEAQRILANCKRDLRK